jgi:hypothetical protein
MSEPDSGDITVSPPTAILSGEPAPKPPSWLTLVRDARSLDDLRTIWVGAVNSGELDTDLRAAVRKRTQEIREEPYPYPNPFHEGPDDPYPNPFHENQEDDQR